MKRSLLTTLILFFYAGSVVCLTYIVMRCYNILDQDQEIFADSDPLLKLLLSAFPLIQYFIVATIGASLGINKIYSDKTDSKLCGAGQKEGE